MDAFMKSLVILGFVFVSKFTVKNLIKNWVNLLLVLFTETRLDFFFGGNSKIRWTRDHHSFHYQTTVLSVRIWKPNRGRVLKVLTFKICVFTYFPHFSYMSLPPPNLSILCPAIPILHPLMLPSSEVALNKRYQNLAKKNKQKQRKQTKPLHTCSIVYFSCASTGRAI